MSDSMIEPRLRSKDTEFYMTLVTFEVQNILFKVPVDAFQTRSEAFRDMFSLPVGAGESTEGASDDSPIVLEGVDAGDFRALLRYLYPKKYVSNPDFSQKEWIGIHALAHMWGFEEAKEASKAFLVNMEDSITKFELATRYEYDDWLRKAYKELTYRSDPLSIDEAERVGIRAACHISQVREARWKAWSSSQFLKPDGFFCHSCPLCSADLSTRHSLGLKTTSQADIPKGDLCQSCGITFYDSKDVVERAISQRVHETILQIVPEKNVPPEESNRPCEEAKTDGSVTGSVPGSPESLAIMSLAIDM